MLPMQKTSTSFRGEAGSVHQVARGPKATTVELIKQFARAYSFSSVMPLGLGGFVAN